MQEERSLHLREIRQDKIGGRAGGQGEGEGEEGQGEGLLDLLQVSTAEVGRGGVRVDRDLKCGGARDLDLVLVVVHLGQGRRDGGREGEREGGREEGLVIDLLEVPAAEVGRGGVRVDRDLEGGGARDLDLVLVVVHLGQGGREGGRGQMFITMQSLPPSLPTYLPRSCPPPP